MLTKDLQSQIDKIWTTFWTGGVANPLTVIEQITYLLFIKRLDELQTLKEAKANATGKPIEDPIYKPEQCELRWNRFQDLEPQALYDLFRTPVDGAFDFIKKLGEGKENSFSKYLKGATFMIPTPRLLTLVVDLISEVNMKDRDTKGDIYEYLLSKLASAGQNGQFRTPRHIIKMMVALMEPKINEVICDPAAGTCGFLVIAGEYIREKYQMELFKEDARNHFQNEMFIGTEFDATMIRIGAMNMLLHGIENADLKDLDALSKANTEFTEKCTLILANPPFKGSLDYEAVDDKILRIVKSKKTELLFLGLMLKGLKVGGRAAVIVPDGVLFGSSKAHLQIRKEIIDKHKLEAIISMPSGVFKPYAGVSTAVMIFTKTDSGGTDQVWFYDMAADGRSLDDKRTELGPGFETFGDLDKLIEQHKESPISYTDIPDIVLKWRNKEKEVERKRTDKSFWVPAQEIRDNKYDLSINKYKEIEYEEKIYEKPSVIIAQIENLDKERIALMNQLKTLLA